jgi:hypothetical protein
MRKDILERKEDILEWISINQSKAYMCTQLKCKATTLDSWLKKMNINYGGNKSGKGIKKDPKRKTAKEYVETNINVKTYVLKHKLLEDKIKEYKCERCNNFEWLGVKIPLELHHIDGDRYNNDFNNLEILCPNCHALTENYCGKNKK